MPRIKTVPKLATCALLCAVLHAPGLPAREDQAGLCRDAAASAAARTGVPYGVLLAITTIETGRDNRPWPWTVNFGGDGHWFDTVDDAETSVTEAVENGATNVDLGCFQLNYRWHAKGFATVADMLDPDQNATYAAEFLAEHFAQTGDWALAAAAYHSGTPEYAKIYKAKFEAAYAEVADESEAPTEEPADAERLNRFPLLVAGATGSGGSLVPSGSGGIPLIGGP